VVAVDRPAEVRDGMALIKRGGRADAAKLRDEDVALASLG